MLLGDISEALAGPASSSLLFAVGRDLLVEQRLSVILDSPAGYLRVVDQAVALARDGDACLKVILCLADRELRNQRVAARHNRPSQPLKPGGSTTPGDGRQRFAHLPPGTLYLQTAKPIAILLPEALAYLTTAASDNAIPLEP